MGTPTKRALGIGVVASALSPALVGTASSARIRPIAVRLQPVVVEYQAARVTVSGIAASSVSARLRGANDPAGMAYTWAPYRWQRLRPVQGRWRGVLPAPPLRGIYQVQLRIGQRERVLQSPHWLLRVLPPGTLDRRAVPTPRGVIRDYVRALPGNEVLIDARPWPPAGFDHRDPRLQRLFVVAYASRGNESVDARRGLFITTVRAGYRGRWRLLEATTAPYD